MRLAKARYSCFCQFYFMKIVFLGTPQAAVPTLQAVIRDGHEIAAVYTQPDRPSGRGNKIVFSPVKQFALEHGIKFLQPTKIKTPEAFAEFKAHNADIAVVVAYGRILPESFLTAFPKGAVNVHFSLLPKYRGAAPVNWAIANGETTTGITTMKMDIGLDTGDILLQEETKIGDAETAPELMERLSVIGAELLSQTLQDFDEIDPRKQDESEASHASILKREDGLIDWNLPAAEIANRVRGFQPFPSSFTFRNGSRITIRKAEIVNPERLKAAASGSVIGIEHDAFSIQCGNNSVLRITEIQPEGKRLMNATDFINGTHLKMDESFGN